MCRHVSYSNHWVSFNQEKLLFIWLMYSRLSRCSTARGSSTGLFCVGPTKFKACKSFILSHFASMLYAVAKCHSNFYTIFSLLIDHLTDNIEIKTTLKCLQKSCQFLQYVRSGQLPYSHRSYQCGVKQCQALTINRSG